MKQAGGLAIGLLAALGGACGGGGSPELTPETWEPDTQFDDDVDFLLLEDPQSEVLAILSTRELSLVFFRAGDQPEAYPDYTFRCAAPETPGILRPLTTACDLPAYTFDTIVAVFRDGRVVATPVTSGIVAPAAGARRASDAPASFDFDGDVDVDEIVGRIAASIDEWIVIVQQSLQQAFPTALPEALALREELDQFRTRPIVDLLPLPEFSCSPTRVAAGGGALEIELGATVECAIGAPDDRTRNRWEFGEDNGLWMPYSYDGSLIRFEARTLGNYRVRLLVTDRNTHLSAFEEIVYTVVEPTPADDRRRFTCNAPTDGVCTEYTVPRADYDALVAQCGGVVTHDAHVCGSGFPSCTIESGGIESRTVLYDVPPAEVEAACRESGGTYRP